MANHEVGASHAVMLLLLQPVTKEGGATKLMITLQLVEPNTGSIAPFLTLKGTADKAKGLGAAAAGGREAGREAEKESESGSSHGDNDSLGATTRPHSPELHDKLDSR
jgi:hypothetical protein